ncbi:MAG: hypothetical protein GKR77_00560 [Legionellales bacterium]|nr:hypothetical protein [Legionellales bacterium]
MNRNRRPALFKQRVTRGETNFFGLVYDDRVKGFKINSANEQEVASLINCIKKYEQWFWFEISKAEKNEISKAEKKNNKEYVIFFKDANITNEEAAKSSIVRSYKQLERYNRCNNCLPYVIADDDDMCVFDLAADENNRVNYFQVTSTSFSLTNIERALNTINQNSNSSLFDIIFVPSSKEKLYLVFKSSDSSLTVEQAKQRLQTGFHSFRRRTLVSNFYDKQVAQYFIQGGTRKRPQSPESSCESSSCKRQKLSSSSSSDDDKKSDLQQSEFTSTRHSFWDSTALASDMPKFNSPPPETATSPSFS